MKYFKESRSRNHFNRSKDGEQIVLENICVVLDTKILIQKLNVECMFPLDRTSTYGNDILGAATFSLSVHNKFIWILIYYPIYELLSIPFCIVGIKANLLVESTGDILQVWVHTEEG